VGAIVKNKVALFIDHGVVCWCLSTEGETAPYFLPTASCSADGDQDPMHVKFDYLCVMSANDCMSHPGDERCNSSPLKRMPVLFGPNLRRRTGP